MNFRIYSPSIQDNETYSIEEVSESGNSLDVQKTAAISPANEIPSGFSISYKSPLEMNFNKTIKRSIDLIVSLVLIICILSWLTLLLSLLIRMQSAGPVFFLQKRFKKNGRIFTCIKFRTMIRNKDCDVQTACINDIRITSIGRFLRKTHLDEWPQLLNVLLGDMSLIGPRPYMIHEKIWFSHFRDSYLHRYSVRPGITGLAQSYGFSGEVHDLEKTSERMRLDFDYIQHWSLWLDVKIACRTVLLISGVKKINHSIVIQPYYKERSLE